MSLELIKNEDRRSERERLGAEVLPVENTELGLSVNLFAERQKLIKALSTNARGAVEEMTELCNRGMEKSRGSFLTLIGAKNVKGDFREGADMSEEEFLENSREFLNSVFIPMPAREASGVSPRGLGKWLRALEDNLRDATRECGDEQSFRVKQNRFRELRQEPEEPSEAKEAA